MAPEIFHQELFSRQDGREAGTLQECREGLRLDPPDPGNHLPGAESALSQEVDQEEAPGQVVTCPGSVAAGTAECRGRTEVQEAPASHTRVHTPPGQC